MRAFDCSSGDEVYGALGREMAALLLGFGQVEIGCNRWTTWLREISGVIGGVKGGGQVGDYRFSQTVAQFSSQLNVKKHLFTAIQLFTSGGLYPASPHSPSFVGFGRFSMSLFDKFCTSKRTMLCLRLDSSELIFWPTTASKSSGLGCIFLYYMISLALPSDSTSSCSSENPNRRKGLKMSGANEEEKKPMDQSAHINLKVKGQDGNEVFFRIKRVTQLKKLMTAYCDRQSVDQNSIAFLFDGRRLRAEQTPDELEMEDGDEIDAMLHQTGGSFGGL
ncbi:hypothetical protein NE237_012397 [Protea cynaroides]|uniref:Ubiquitin-like domain-containing protein n=1 Tax=Protea cynaroides TaxID=273540 RepID=A0A9Q0H1R9_9MAGN|nr:hypothetical protein NE237_012397 [Protea cynaroides]